MKRLLLAVAALVLCAADALAQQVPPYTYPQTIGTSSVTILAPNNSRKKLIFHNPNDSAKVAVCPVGPTRAVGGSASLIVAVINGAGCITILPYDRVEIAGTAPTGPAISSAWVGIASAGASALTIFEME